MKKRIPILGLCSLLSFPLWAWDDDDFDASSNKRKSSIQNSSYDSSYKNQNQANSTQHTSLIDFGGPKHLVQQEEYISPQHSYETKRTSALHVDTIEEAVEKRTRRNEELMVSYQQQYKEQEARQERSHAQQAKQQAVYDEMNQQECEMAEFVGGVFKAKFGATTGRDSAVTSEGYIFRSGNNFVTPRGIYTKTGNTYAGPSSFTTQTGTLFFGNKGTTIQAGGAFSTDGQSGYVVGPNCRTKPDWSSR